MFAVIWNDPDAEEVRCLRVAKTEEEANRLMAGITVPSHMVPDPEDEDEEEDEGASLKVVNLLSEEGERVLEDLNAFLENTEDEAFDY